MPENKSRPKVEFIYLKGEPMFAYMPLIEYVRLLERANEALEERLLREQARRAQGEGGGAA